MKKISCIILFIFTLSIYISSAQQIGDLDLTFNLTGKVITDFNGGTDGASAVLVQPDGKILVSGYSGVGTNYRFALSRYLVDGSLDTTFGGTGMVITDFAPGYDYAGTIALQADGKIVAGGVKRTGSSGDNALIRYLADGSLDSTFGNGGKVENSVGIADAGISQIVIQPDGKIVAAGICTTISTGHDFATTRYLPNGNLDSLFGINGTVISDFASSADFPFCIALQQDGKIVVGGATGQDPVFDFGLIRYDTIGNPDTTFGINGKVVTNFGRPDEWANAVNLQDDGKILLAGYSGNPYNIAVARYLETGDLDTTFNLTGKVLTAVSAHDEGNAMALQQDGKIIIGGVSYTGSNQDFCLLRYNSDGSLDTAFSGNGSVTTDFGTNADKIKGVALQADGKIVAAGVAGNDFAVARYLVTLSTGVIDFTKMNRELFIYPNPVNELATLTYELMQPEFITIYLTDMQGKLIKTFVENQLQPKGKCQTNIQFPGELNPGSYILVISNNREQLSIKVIR